MVMSETLEKPMIPAADLYIASLGRSGSTLLANLLTTPPNRFVLVEPQLHLGEGNAWMFEQLDRFGWSVGTEEIDLWRSLPPERRVSTFLYPRLTTLEKWGVKEVDPKAHLPSLATLRPRKVIILVRNVRDVIISYIEKYRREGKTDYGAELLNFLVESTNMLIHLTETLNYQQMRVVRYEDFVTSERERAAVSRWLGWPLDGDPNRNLDLYKRTFEIERHNGEISSVSVNRHAAMKLQDSSDIINNVAEYLSSFQKSFNYTDPPKD